MARSVHIPGIKKLAIADDRQAIPRLHTYLRESILNGTLPPGWKISQVHLAEQLGVSRTPVREVLRMLQEEHLVEFEPNQRMRVAGFDPEVLDSDYACRILLESLALSLTLPTIDKSIAGKASEALKQMQKATDAGNTAGWFRAHRRYHELLGVGASSIIRRQLRSYADRSTRYLQINQTNPKEWQQDRHPEHVAILDAVLAGEDHAAVVHLAQHLSRAATFVLNAMAPDYTPSAVPRAVALACGEQVPTTT